MWLNNLAKLVYKSCKTKSEMILKGDKLGSSINRHKKRSQKFFSEIGVIKLYQIKFNYLEYTNIIITILLNLL